MFASGYNCAQSVLGVFCGEDGLDVKTALKLANGFGGGIRCGEMCGAVTGAVMAIGLKCGFYIENDLEQKMFCNQKTYEFIEKFTAANGSAVCRGLLAAGGIDIRKPEDHTIESVAALHQTVCPKAIASAVQILENMNFTK